MVEKKKGVKASGNCANKVTLLTLHQATGHLTAYLGAGSVARGISEPQAHALQKGLKLLASDAIHY